MTPTIAHIDDASREEWQRVYSACGHATYFHSPSWAQLWSACSHGHWRPAPLAVRFDDGCTAIVVRSSRLVANDPEPPLQMSAAAGTFGGWISGDALTRAHAEALRDVLLAMPNLRWRVNPYDRRAVEITPGFAEAQHTMTLDLRAGLPAVQDRWRRGPMLRAVRKATRCRLQTRAATAASDWTAYYRLYELSLTRWGSRVSSRYDEHVFTTLSTLDSANVRLWLTCLDGQPIAGAIVLYAREHAAYWHGAADAAHFDLRPANLLMHDVVLNAVTRGLAWFDFNPSGGHGGVEAFKRHCGADPLPAPVVRTAVSGLARAIA